MIAKAADKVFIGEKILGVLMTGHAEVNNHRYQTVNADWSNCKFCGLYNLTTRYILCNCEADLRDGLYRRALPQENAQETNLATELQALPEKII